MLKRIGVLGLLLVGSMAFLQPVAANAQDRYGVYGYYGGGNDRYSYRDDRHHDRHWMKEQERREKEWRRREFLEHERRERNNYRNNYYRNYGPNNRHNSYGSYR